ncbi:MAG: right-handed parallel beta-helix repeat-containing protein [Pirellulaceae bacterium]|nr:right-handed parallel beta-helix repeat-containing protein [Pirellulaceae bacterium]
MRNHAVRFVACWISALTVFGLVLSSFGQEAGEPRIAPAPGIHALEPVPFGGRVLYVDPGGDDAWSGTLAAPNTGRTDGPVATVVQAQQIARGVNAEGITAPIIVLLREGTYWQNRPLVFTPEDSGTEACPVAYAAYPGERPVVSGGLPISGWKQDGHLWRTNVPPACTGAVGRFNQLFVNGQRRTRARTPNRGEFFRTDGPTVAGGNRSFYFHDDDLREWNRLQDAIVVVYHSWETSIHHIRSVDTESRSVLLREPAPWPMGRWQRQQRYFVENVFEALDEPGEWYLDPGAGTLYYYPLPGETPETVDAVAPVVTSTLVEIHGDPAKEQYVEHLHFRGIAFRHSNSNLFRLRNPGQGEIYQPGLIHAQGLRHASIVDCEIAHTGAHGIWLASGCTDNLVQRCHLRDLGGGGVYLGGGWGIHDQFPAGSNTVDNNLIHDGSHMFRGAHGVWIGRSSHNTVTHNEISNFDYTGISCGWSWGFQPSSANHNILDFNYIHHLGNGDGLGDMGAIYTLGVSPGTTVRHNHIHDVYNYAHVSHGSGIYPDEGSTGILIENNVVYRVRNSPLFMHYGMECIVRNNVLALGDAGQLRRSREDVRCHYIAERNIVYGGANTRMLDGPWKNGDWQIGRNVYWSTGGEPTFAGMDFTAWQEHGKDQGSIVADPRFVDPERYDFRLQPDSPALRLGFQPIDVEQSGLYGDPRWVALPKNYPNRERNEIPPPVEVPLVINFDFEADEPNAEPLDGSIVKGENGAAVLVSADAASGGTRSLKFIDAPDQRYGWTPHVYYQRTYAEGKVKLVWDMLNSAEAPASFFIEARQIETGAPYRVGPTVWVSPDGAVTASGLPVGTMPLGQWVNVSIEIALGAETSGTYRLTLSVPGREPVVREIPYRSEGFRRIDWLGICSNSQTATMFCIDNLKLGTEEELAQPPKRRPARSAARARRMPAEPPNDQQLVGHWAFAEDNDYVVKDQSGYGNDGEVWARLATGAFGTALHCDSANTHVAIEDHDSLRFGTGDFSIDFWICPTTLAIDQSDARRRLMSKNDHPRTWWVLDITPAGRVSLEMADSNRISRVSRTQAGIPENAWSHVAVVVDRTGRQVRFYLNGRLDSAHELPANFTGALDVPAELTLGSTWQPFIGLLDEVRIFKRTLDEAEIKAGYEREKVRRTSAEYRLVE